MNQLILRYVLASTLLTASCQIDAQEKLVALSMTGQPQSYSLHAGAYKVMGYGNAHFGMSVDEVKVLITQDYSHTLGSLKDEIDPAQKTRVLTMVVPELVPGPGPATISYVFGATSKRLIAVNVYWLVTGMATDAQQAQLTEAARVLAADLVGYRWPIFTVARGHVLAPGVLLVFAGKDAVGGGIEVRLNGVAYTLEARQASVASVATPETLVVPRGPAQLRFSMVANVDKPDIETLPN
ncbi:hypothetical protein MIZ03_0755 [Rhodoferax lithotrophicus]|uniref:Uncharacterized protein n=1 Tax=Rhodoferax lithotrophicus TaxID=2798804 RepID=A0ABM7MI22_9BURK|nr:hypothetical protein [Rhodoferax sp. MIZ03]BCO25876.1 hypothetical protein MIZ03_0755 [Rhodoferax sp. MIZ03]